MHELIQPELLAPCKVPALHFHTAPDGIQVADDRIVACSAGIICFHPLPARNHVPGRSDIGISGSNLQKPAGLPTQVGILILLILGIFPPDPAMILPGRSAKGILSMQLHPFWSQRYLSFWIWENCPGLTQIQAKGNAACFLNPREWVLMQPPVKWLTVPAGKKY